jgi:hypothetical protein
MKFWYPTEAILCHGDKFSNPSHGEACDLCTRYITRHVYMLAKLNIPLTRAPSTGCIPGWNEYVAPFHEEARFWHQLWVDNGRPLYDVVEDVLRQKKVQYCPIGRSGLQVILHARWRQAGSYLVRLFSVFTLAVYQEMCAIAL